MIKNLAGLVFFFGMLYEEEDAPVEQEIRQAIDQSEHIKELPELNMVDLSDVDQWLFKYKIASRGRARKQLLKEHGWNAENLPVLEYGTTPGPTARLFYEQFRAWMKQIGYPPEKIVLKTYATFGDIAKAWRNSELPLSHEYQW